MFNRENSMSQSLEEETLKKKIAVEKFMFFCGARNYKIFV